jgi:hypothetical protein
MLDNIKIVGNIQLHCVDGMLEGPGMTVLKRILKERKKNDGK